MRLSAQWWQSMKLIDANVILRYLLDDHEVMSVQARQTIVAGAVTTVEVLAEVVYVLKGVYGADREEIAVWLGAFLDEVVLDAKPAIHYALRVYGETSLDFVDCVLLGYHRILGREILTFDRKLNRLLADA